MPIYEYRCEKCGESFDFLARTLADKPTECPHCEGKYFHKILSTFSAAVKGSGGCPSAGTCGHAHGPGCCCCH